jgi:hypothetical protein
MIAYVIGALIVGAVIGIAIGIAIGGSRERRAIQAPALAGAAPGPAEPALPGPLPTVPEPTVPEPTAAAAPSYAEPELPVSAPGAASEGAARPAEPRQAAASESHLAVTTTNIQVAEAVLEVADRLASQELSRRLGDALHRLDGVSILTPEVGAEFEPDLHDWIATRAVTEGHIARTIAATKVPGMARADGTVIRKARVVVFE